MASKRKSDPIIDLLRNIDSAIIGQMQHTATAVLSGKLPDKKDTIAKGHYQGLEAARAIIQRVHKLWQQGDEDDDVEE